MARTDAPLQQRRVLYDASLCIRKGVYTDLYNDIYQHAN